VDNSELSLDTQRSALVCFSLIETEPIMNRMDLSTRPHSARAGYNQGRALAARLIDFWR